MRPSQDIGDPLLLGTRALLPHAATADGTDWQRWIRGMGHYTRRLREFVGLSQEEIARRAGVSQGAVSRLEGGRAVNTPLVAVMKINAAMRQALQRVDPKLLSRETRRLMAVPGRGVPRSEQAFERLDVAVEPQLTEVIRLYRRVAPKDRKRFVALVRAAATVLGPGRERGRS